MPSYPHFLNTIESLQDSIKDANQKISQQTSQQVTSSQNDNDDDGQSDVSFPRLPSRSKPPTLQQATITILTNVVFFATGLRIQQQAPLFHIHKATEEQSSSTDTVVASFDMILFHAVVITCCVINSQAVTMHVFYLWSVILFLSCGLIVSVMDLLRREDNGVRFSKQFRLVLAAVGVSLLVVDCVVGYLSSGWVQCNGIFVEDEQGYCTECSLVEGCEGVGIFSHT